MPRKYAIGLWLTAGGFACLFSLYHLSATLVDGAFIPAEHDSFYHARRIIDAIGDPLRMVQFDPRIHAPEGSWVTWPWAYDMLLAWLAGALMALTGAAAPMSVLAFVAPAWVFVNAALFLGVAARLRLSPPMQAVAMAFFATLPLTQGLHRVGMLDHHFVEYSFVLAALYLGLGWFDDLANRRRAIALGVLLGAAPAFHNGLFVLQLPVLLTFGCLWAMRRQPDPRATLAFAAALVAGTALFLLPSEPFRRGEFSFYLHSGFHLYAAFCSALLCVLASRLRFSPAAAAGALAVLAAMAAPVLPQLVLGRDFLFVQTPYLERLGELGSIPRDIARGELWRLTLSYSPFLWLLPLGIGGLLWRLRRDAGPAALFFLAQTLVGAFLMLQTFRLHYFGTFALVLPLCLLYDEVRARRPELLASAARRLALGAAAAASVLLGLLSLLVVYPPGSDPQYAMAREVYRVLGAACRKAPGVVLAGHNDGHPIRYHSECAVIANNFITTPQHVEKVRLSEELLAGPAAAVAGRAPYVRYILVTRADDLLAPGRICGLDCPANDGLRRELLSLDGKSVPPGLRLLHDLRYRVGDKVEPYAMLFEVTR